MHSIYWIIIACAVGTYLTRLLPLYLKPVEQKTRLKQIVHAMLLALGPSAIIALLIVSVWPLLHIEHLSLKPLAVIVGLLGVWLAHRIWKGIALPTFAGVIIYGIMLYLIQL